MGDSQLQEEPYVFAEALITFITIMFQCFDYHRHKGTDDVIANNRQIQHALQKSEHCVTTCYPLSTGTTQFFFLNARFVSETPKWNAGAFFVIHS